MKNGVEIRTYSENGYRYLRVSDLGQHGIESDNPRYVDVEEIPEKIKLANNSFLVSRSGSLGLVSVVGDEIKKAILSSHIFKVNLDTTKIRPEYLEAFLKSQIGQIQFFQNNNGAVIPEISQTALKSIRVVLPPSNIQNHIVSFMRSAYAQKSRKEQEADALLDSIDDYVLKELGIEMPAVEEKKCFVIYAGEMAGRRVDPRFHQSKYQEVTRVLESSKYSITRLSTLITDLKNGVEIRTYSNHGYRYLRVSDLGKNGIENHDPRYVDVDEIPDRVRLTDNSFLISRSGSLGLVSVIEDEIRNTVLGSDIFKVELDAESIHPRYLETFFRSQIGQTLIFQLNSGSIIPRLDQPAVKSLNVVVPPFDVQEKIADEAMRRRSEAAKLIQEADTIVEQAKERVEQILLAEE
ncbi:MAG: restriction endonuclease subunit S [Candidatus Poribacteria bacterium]|nr:restriction endonuclease subunit S [Candidatus Poribacteria bacterium]